MSLPIISLKNIIKDYQIGEYHGGGLINILTNLVKGHRPLVAPKEVHRALHDITFDIGEGEVVGIIGPNGSGKSTLLKILARITDPSSGEGIVRGRIAPLLEVGTGFNPELTGRENVYVNGSLLGMSDKEIRREFDNIVSFAGVERYIDTPIKRYSSGMKVRLGFAVAAHLQPEILLVDEVLAVGDAAFQKRCVDKMSEVHKNGRTIIFVSHQMDLVKKICNRTLCMENGKIIDDDETSNVIARYFERLGSGSNSEYDLLKDANRRPGNGAYRFKSAWIDNPQNPDQRNIIETGKPARVHIEWQSDQLEQLRGVNLAIWIEDLNGDVLVGFSTKHTNQTAEFVQPIGKAICEIEDVNLTPGTYKIKLGGRINYSGWADNVMDAATFEVIPGDFFGTGQTGFKNSVLLLRHNWRFEDMPSDVDAST